MIASATVEELKDKLTADLGARTEWDERPALFTLHKASGQGVRLVQVPIPEQLWTTFGHPPTAVVMVAAGALRMPRNPDGSHMLVFPGSGPLIGAAFRYEAYAITKESDHPVVQEAARRREAGGSVPPFRQIPGRIEQRCLTAVDLDGGRYMASSDRIDGSRLEATEPKVSYVAFADPKRDQLSGRVVDATIRFLNAVKPVPVRGGIP